MRASFNAMKHFKPDPYCAFRNDRARLLALVSRDVRYVLVIVFVLTCEYEIPWRMLTQLLRYAV